MGNQISDAGFKVHSVPINKERKPRIKESDVHAAWVQYGEVVACSPMDSDAPAISSFEKPNLFAQAVYTCFYEHYPLKINPNIVWITITLAFARYVNENAEEIRAKFVQFQGKKTLTVSRPDFRYNNPHNDWPSVFPQFTEEMSAYISRDTLDVLECNFSNTTLTDRVTSHIVIMDTFQKYFNYRMICGCGIPSIELLGTLDDWRLIRAKAERLGQFAIGGEKDILSSWMQELLPVLDQFVLAASGSPDICFWGSVCQLCGGSGGYGLPVTGWIQVFFPYDAPYQGWRASYEEAKKLGVKGVLAKGKALRRERAFSFGGAVAAEPAAYGAELDKFPAGIAKAPVEVSWLDVGKKEDLQFCSGLATIHQHRNGALEVRTGWAVVRPRPSNPKR